MRKTTLSRKLSNFLIPKLSLYHTETKVDYAMIYSGNPDMKKWINIFNLLPPDQGAANVKALKFISETW